MLSCFELYERTEQKLLKFLCQQAALAEKIIKIQRKNIYLYFLYNICSNGHILTALGNNAKSIVNNGPIFAGIFKTSVKLWIRLLHGGDYKSP